MNKLFILCVLLFSTMLFSQNQGSISGNIVDQEMNNEPLLFAQVTLKNTSKSVATNFHGNFEINNVEAGNYMLVITYLGYETLELPTIVKENDVTVINTGMMAKTISLDDITSMDTAQKENVSNGADIRKGSEK